MEDRSPAPRIAVHALGCKLNQAELEDCARQLESDGFTLVGPREEADAYVLNTCTVTAEADRKVRQWLRGARRRNPHALIVASGCSATCGRDGLLCLADIVLDNDDKELLPAVIASRLRPRPVRPGATSAPGWRPRTRAAVKIQEGCSMPCAYCVIPLVRGAERSIAAVRVASAVADRVCEGHSEVVLTGTRVGAYSADGLGLSGLVARALAVEGLRRLRLSSLQPHELTPDLLRLWSDPRLCPHVHMSLQSGSESVLRRMRRTYSPGQFSAAMTALRAAAPHMAITTDVIVGFPGESEEDFRESLAFCESAGFSRIHVFPFSARPGTAAAEMDDVVPPDVVRSRVAEMNRLAARSRTGYELSCLGSVRDVLWEEEEPDGVYAGTTGDYIRVLCDDAGIRVNAVETVVLDRVERGGVRARRSYEGPR